MTIEQKATRYDEAIKKAETLYKASEPMSGCKVLMETIFPELKESEDDSDDEMIRKDCIKYLDWEYQHCPHDNDKMKIEKCIAWIEKQGKKNPTDTDNKFIRMRETKPKDISEFLDRLTTVEQDFLWEHIAKIRELDKEDHKPVNKVEPKFKVGDILVSDEEDRRHIYKVDAITNYDTYILLDLEDGYTRNEPTYTSDLAMYLWTIEDAKDGDVLSDGTTIFIFKDSLSDDSVMSYCDYDTDSGESDAFCPLSMNLICSKITFATKEQCDTLMKAMAEAGYTFDFEKKELKKIIDEKQIKENLQDNSFRRMFDQKPVWSEDDERLYRGLHNLIYSTPYCDSRKELSDWLKSIKERYTWKPSGQQMKVLLSEVTAWTKGCPKQIVLESLYNDLKKL